VTTDFGSLLAGVSALVLQPDGKLVAAGESSGDFTLARYESQLVVKDLVSFGPIGATCQFTSMANLPSRVTHAAVKGVQLRYGGARD
jgi:hypothetical protein